VEEVLVDGSTASINKGVVKPALNASASKQRYLLCVLVKRNWDTFIVVKNVAMQLGMDQTRIQIAGIKDAKAITAQHITIESVTVEDVEKVKLKDVEVRPVGYFRDALSPFYLLGNQFTITIKAIGHPEATIRQSINTTVAELEAQGGIPNFFGHQRFGTTRAITHLVGRAIVKGNFQEAALLFLAKPSVHEHPESRAAREELETTQDFVKAWENFPRQLRFEKMLLRHLVDKPNDFAGAFQQLPIKLQLLFVQAYQSYIFNCFLSERIRRGFALDAAEIGDYVVNVERSGLPMTKTGKLVTAASLVEINGAVKAGKMRVALPLVGFRQKLSEGEMGRLEARILEEEGLELGCFRVREIPRISGQGELRPITCPIRNFKLENVSHDEGDSDFQKAELSFRLLRGSYATMLLREVMKPEDLVNAGF
jgi:tRNA pseudouridine13 synthase